MQKSSMIFRLRVKVCVYFFFQLLYTIAFRSLQALDMVHRLWAHVQQSWHAYQYLLPWFPPSIHSGSFSFLVFHRVAWVMMDGFAWEILFRTACSKISHYLPIGCWWLSVLVLICYRRKLPWWCLNKAELSFYSRMSSTQMSSYLPKCDSLMNI